MYKDCIKMHTRPAEARVATTRSTGIVQLSRHC
jgi:hypothetical protein